MTKKDAVALRNGTLFARMLQLMKGEAGKCGEGEEECSNWTRDDDGESETDN